ncbi:hypothetical protein ANT_02160 [Anaerolinea thermophila UNI-1]|uniref:Uncharacterized protein n=1 Tax=Anaerolinea thermophila (strain DSM 14523 / JCM 11388 / NBRC 100420 / UNI-1) TaxID=926569 RepID=E8MZA7_ANATU|nr:hypothetical protein ANT_02160 [Anaerolinea thermophila UNI-1]
MKVELFDGRLNMSTLVSLFADSRKVRLVVFALMLVLFSFATSGFVFASNEEPPLPSL